MTSHSPTQSLLDYSVQLWHPEISSKGYYHLPIKGPGNHPTCQPNHSWITLSSSGILTYLPKATTICQSKDLATIPLAQPNHSWITLSSSGILTYLPKATTICQSKDLASHPTCPTQSLLDYSVQLWHPEISSKGHYHLPIKGPGNHPTCPTQSLLDYSVQLWHPDISSKGHYHLPIKGPGNLLPDLCLKAIPLAHPITSWLLLSTLAILTYLSKRLPTILPINKDAGNLPRLLPFANQRTLAHPTLPIPSLLITSFPSSGILTYLPKATTICQSKDLASHPSCPTQSLLDYSVQLWHPEISSQRLLTICQSKDLATIPLAQPNHFLDYSVQLWHPDISSKRLLTFANQRTWQPSHLPNPITLGLLLSNSGILTYLPKATTICQSKDLASKSFFLICTFKPSHLPQPNHSWITLSSFWHPDISSKGYYHLPIKGPGNHPTCPTQSLLDYSVQLWHPEISSKGYYHLPIIGPGK
ncbi:hypothetical protein PGT21_000098 [Puccinia graminis f. sp. tritici]|uniref:Uncharacterized protein n=1 Tax=Puccinia graminis f. sp. tritici TaxID=56615 RepID=A0A5B0MYQ9_PUCGR|nr:hypothetical protein PGT21_000098 [Puccinia graminis f. sp. tritici]